MASLKHETTGRRFTLGAGTMVGRSSACTLVLEMPKVSGRHASLLWADGSWVLRDLGSRNGTYLDGKRLDSGARTVISAGAVIGFAADRWTLVDDGPPSVAAFNPNGQRRLAEDGLLVLPDDVDPSVTIYGGAGGRWVAERDDETARIRDGQVIEIDGVQWTLEVPPPTPAGDTAATMGPEGGIKSIDTLSRMTLAVSRDEETVEVRLDFLGDPLNMPNRSFNYLLVVLARARERDAAEGEPAAEQGWMYREDVCREIAVDPERLNVEIYRCRKMLAKLGVDGAARFFERRPHTRQLRLTVECAEIVPLG